MPRPGRENEISWPLALEWSVVKRSLLFGLALTVLGVACGGASDDPVRSEGSVTPSEQSTTTTTAAPTTTSTTAKKQGLTAEKLQAALLTVDDLPTGYAVSPPDEDEDDDSDDEFCEAIDPGKTVPPAIEKEVAFQKGSFGPFLSSGLMLFSGDDQAKRYMAESRKILDTCASYEQTEDDGTKSKVTITKMSFDKVGDETLAMKISVQGTFPMSGDMIFARRGDVILGVANLALGSADTSETVKAMSKADEKLRRIL